MTTTALAPIDARRALRGFGMNDRFGPVLAAFARRFLDAIPYPDEAADKVKRLAEQGTVVYVHRSRNLADYLALQSTAARYGLPMARFVGGLNVAALQPWWRFPRRKEAPASRGDLTPDEWRLRVCVDAGFAVQLFLRRPLTLITGSSSQPSRFVEELIDLARERERPIYLVPHFLALRSEPGSFEPTAADAIFGSAEEPGHLRALARLMLSRGIARWEVSEPIDLSAFAKKHAGQPAPRLAKKVRWTLLHHLARIERLAHGPPIKNPVRLREETFRDPILQRQLNEISADEGRPLDELWLSARKIYDEIASRPDFDLARLADKIVRPAWRLIYDGIHIDQRDIDRMRTASREGPVILVPSHRSHIDYMMISQTFLWNGLLPPHGAAGINLNFFPVGPFMRRLGAFFIRRTFKGDRVYSAVFKAYVRRLYREGFTQEFFIEGTRSRTGKTLPPKLGFLSMLVEAFVEGRQNDAIFVPSHISYEKIIESASYMRELGGGEKEAETMGALVKSTGSILRSRYGRVFVTFDEPISLKEFIASQGTTKEAMRGTSGEDLRRKVTSKLAYRIVYGINNAVVVTANALAITVLFGFRRRGLDAGSLQGTVELLLRHIRRVSGDTARLATGLVHDPERALALALERLEVDGRVVKETAADKTFYRIADGAFLELDFYKNNIIHFFVPEAILATAMRSLGARPGERIPLAEVRDRTQWLSRTFRHEFIFEEGPFDALFEQTLSRAREYGVVEVGDDGVSLLDAPEARRFGGFLANLLANFADSYWSAANHVAAAAARPVPRRALVLRLLELCRADFLGGEITCPEAVSRANLDFAVTALVEAGVLEAGAFEAGVLEVSDEVRLAPGGEAARAAFLENMDRARLRP